MAYISQISKYYHSLGNRVTHGSHIHKSISKKFYAVIHAPTYKLGLLLVSSKKQLSEILEILSLANAIRNEKLHISVVTTSESLASSFFNVAKENGFGILLVTSTGISERLPPSFAQVQGETLKKQVIDTITNINTISQARWGIYIFNTNLTQFNSQQIPCTSDNDTTSLLLTIATIIDSVKQSKILAVTGKLSHDSTAVEYLDEFLKKQNYKVRKGVFIKLKLIKRLRNNRPPVHQGKKYGNYCSKLTGNRRPTNQDLSWACVNQFLSAVLMLREDIR